LLLLLTAQFGHLNKSDISTLRNSLADGEWRARWNAQLLTGGPKGQVRANIMAREVVIFGSVKGNIEVTGKIAIRGESSLVGNIKAAGIGIDDGAYFKGSIDIVRPEPRAAAPVAPVEEAAEVRA